jgi:large subunit ribosomal protein L4
MKADLYDKQNKKAGTVDLPERIFGVKWNPTLVQQAFVTQVSNRRNVLAHTKGRGDVRGGGKKPWAQKHTGRSRHSSVRSPLWPGGGVTFGPTKERNFSKKINKKMKRVALYSVLSKKLAAKEIRFIDDLNFQDHKTKNLAKVLIDFFKKNPSVLVVPRRGNRNIFTAGRNIPKVAVSNVPTLNVYDCLAHEHMLFEKGAIAELTNDKQTE